jgi:hypothetical protein
MANQYPFTWEDVGEKGGGDGVPFTQAEKEAIAVEWNSNHEEKEAIAWVAHRIEGKTNSHIDANNKRIIDSKEEGYPSIPEQLDMKYWDIINGTTVWKDTIAAVKAKFPKPA